MYSSWNPTAAYDTGPFAEYADDNRFSLGNQLGFWVAPDRGILIWTPVILLLLPALLRSWRELPDWSTSLALGGFGYTLLQGVLSRFSGGDVFYGYRLGLEMLACATPVLAFSAYRMGAVGRALIGPVIGVQFLAIAWGSVRDAAYLPFDQAWHHNAFEVVVRHDGIVGWVAVALALGMGSLVQRMWLSGSPSPEERQQPLIAGT
jgi:alpha-1,2-mannosyltransferase